MLGTRRDAMIDSVIPGYGLMRRIRLASGVAALALGAALPVQAQQYGGGTSVVVDYGVLDQLSAAPASPQAPGSVPSVPVYTQPYGSLQPYGTQLQPLGAPQAAPVTPVQTASPAGSPYDSGQLLPPPSTAPVSRLTVPYKPSPSVADNVATKPSSVAAAVVKPVAFVTPALKPAEPETKLAASVPASPPETVAEAAPASTVSDSGAGDTATGSSAVPVVEATATSTTVASNDAATTTEVSTTQTAAASTAGTTSSADAPAIATAAVTTASTAGAAAATAATDTGASDTGEAATTVAQNDTSTTAPSGSEAPAATTAPATQPSGDATAPAADSSQTGSTETPAAEPAQDKTQILFPEGSAELPPEATQQLDTIAQKMDENQALRLQLMAYASGTEDTASRARRISLSRALAVRAYLIDKGIRSTRMDVRALGNKVEGDPADRVDIVTLTPGG
jgi:outer membrane protein OmpA-like peptidoglycan-associated protein